MEPFMGLIASFGFNFAPRGWMFCDGRLLSIAQNSALFALLGTTYGGDGQTTFALPDLRSRIAVGQGQGPGLSNYVTGQISGTENTTLLSINMPAHNHQMMASSDSQTQNTAAGASLASQGRDGVMPTIYAAGTGNPVAMASTTSNAGGNVPVDIIQPYLCINYCIAVQGIYPSRN